VETFMRRVLIPALLLASTPALAEPPKPTHSTDPARCQWRWQEGAGLGVWTERCAFDTGVWEPKFDASLPGFVITVEGETVDTILHVFSKPADAPVAAILPELKTRRLIPDDDDCVFEPAAIRPAPRTLAFFHIVPRGKRKQAFDATPKDEVPEPPCGDYGWSTHGTRYFLTDIAHPGRVLYVNIGQDGMMFDEKTVTLK
jgi:hypothetical protein